MEPRMPLSKLEQVDVPPKPASYSTDSCEFCRMKTTASDLIRRRVFDEALRVLEHEAGADRACLCERRARKDVIDLNGNLIGSTTEFKETEVTDDAFRRRSVAEFWAHLSCCRIERAIILERKIRGLWDDDVPKRHKKKYSTCADYFKSLSSPTQKVAADLKSFHSLCVAYMADLKGALNAAEKSLEVDPKFDEAHLHVARAVFRIENPSMVGGEERKTISATCHVAKYLKQYDDYRMQAEFNPTLWLFLKELNHALYLDAVTMCPAFDSIRFYDNVLLVGTRGPACFLDLRSAAKYAFDAGMNEVTFLMSPGKYDASFGDVEVPDRARFDVVGNVESKLSGLRWRHVLRNLEKSVSLVASSDATGFSFAGTVDVTFSRLAFVDTTAEQNGSMPLLSVSEGATVTVDLCSFHRGECVSESRDVALASANYVDHFTESAATVDTATHSVGVASNADGVLNVSNSLFFHLSNGAQVDDGGRIHLKTSTFSDAAFSASDNAVVSVDGCEFVNGEFFVHNNCQVEVVKSTFKLQLQHQQSRLPYLPSSSRCLVKIRKGSSSSLSNCRFFAARPVSLERVALDEAECVVPSSLTDGETTAISIGGAGTQVYVGNNVFSHVDKCLSVSDKAKMTMSKNKFLDCGEMVNMSGLARASLEDNHPCARMIPLVLLDEDTDPPEMKGPNTYRVDRRCVSPISPDLSAALESPGTGGIERSGKGRQFCHHCCGDLVKITPKKGDKEAVSKSGRSNEYNSSLTTPSTHKDQKKKKKSREQSVSQAAPKTPTPNKANKSVRDDVQSGASSVSNNRHVRPSSSVTSVSSVSAGSSGCSSTSPINRSSTTPSPRMPSSAASPKMPSSSPSPRGVASSHDASSPTAFLFCACGSSYCSRDCQAEDWKDHRHVCGGKKMPSKSRKLSLG